MILLPALAVVQILKLRQEEADNNSPRLRVRHEVNFQCQQLVDTCQIFESGGNNGCSKVLEFGEVCL